ncbi:MAG TPA: class I SAM-dependent methyltransferase [Chloroflexota bacterium]|nr:class I SAM-dependent methyltransferase [Chloroflexota bacterium]
MGGVSIPTGGVNAAVSTSPALSLPERTLLRLALDLGALEIGGPLTASEQQLVDEVRTTFRTAPATLADVRAAIVDGEDPLGSWLCRVRTPARRRAQGAFYTPPALVDPMLDWVLSHDLDRLIDPGCGSGRFAAGAVRRRPDLPIVAIDLDPFATLLTRATLGVLRARAVVIYQADYTTFDLPDIPGRTAFVGNPPYVRHHDLSPLAKEWVVRTGKRFGHTVSTLAGLHVYFYLATAARARPGDVGCFVTSAEWLDVNYGATVRHLLLNSLGGQSLHLIDPRAVPFADAMATAAIVTFEAGSSPPSMRCQSVASPSDLGDLRTGREVGRGILERARRWTQVVSQRPSQDGPASTVRLRAIARVHRGTVTGANEFFILTGQRARDLGIAAWCRPVVSSAEEIFQSGGIIRDGPERKLLLDAPPDLDRGAHPRLDAYLRSGEQTRGNEPPICARYICQHRHPWWYLGRASPPPIIASYMARQAPMFALNPDGLAVVNIAHGIYPTSPIAAEQLAQLATALNTGRDSFRGHGRTYHGGLEKFEPREMEALLIC